MKQLTSLLLTCAIQILLPAASMAQDESEPWQPVAPDGMPSEYDWIRLPSDEWLKGEIVSMYDDELAFDSDELGTLTLDFADLVEIRTSRVVQVGFEDGEPAIGRLVVDGDSARVVGDDGEREFATANILTLVVGEPKELNYWSGYVNAGGNVRSGNSDQIDYSARLGAQRRALKNRTLFDYVGNITRIDDVDTSNNHRANLAWDRFLTSRLFINVIGAEWFRDRFQNIANRYTLTAGVGYQILDTSRSTWSVTAGPAWQSTEFDSVPPSGDDSVDGAAFRIGTRYDFDLTDDVDYYLDYSAYFTDEANGTYVQHLDTGLDVDLLGNLTFNASWIWDRTEDPQPLGDGSLPKRDDYRLFFGLGWDF